MKILIILPFLAIFLVQGISARQYPLSPLEKIALDLQTEFISLYRGIKFNEARARQILSRSVRVFSCTAMMNIEQLIAFLKVERASGFFVDIVKNSVYNTASGKLIYTAAQYLYFGPECQYKEIKVTASVKNGRYMIDTMTEMKC